MKIPFKSTAIAAALVGMVSVPLVWADDDLPETDAEVVEVADSVPGDRIAGYFGDFFGDDAQTVANGLRDGSIQYVKPLPEGGDAETADAETTDAERTETTDSHGEESHDGEEIVEVEEGAEAGTGMGWGNVVITMALAEELAASMASAESLDGEGGMTADAALNEILGMRQVDGMGWGEIAKAVGVNLGEVISGIRSNRPEMSEKLTKAEERNSMQAEKAAGRMDRSVKAEKTERLAKMDRPERPVKPERAEKPERPEKPQRPERPGK